MAAEIGEAFDVARSLRDGMVPIVVASPTPGEVLKTYISIYIREEIKSEGLVRNLGAFARFLESAALSHGQPLNISNVARDCQVERKTVEGYFSILEDLLIAFRIPVFTRRARRAIACHPKFYFFDCGVFRSIRPKGPLDSIQEISGGALEGLVAQHLRAWIDYSRGDVTLSYWRTSSGSEVDFVMYGESCFHAIEVKAAERVRPEDLRALRAFKEDYPECSPLLVYMGTERLRIGDVLCVPCREFLLGLVPGKEIFRE
jgi:predicted AAA+ superfamily ATPase